MKTNFSRNSKRSKDLDSPFRYFRTVPKFELWFILHKYAKSIPRLSEEETRVLRNSLLAIQMYDHRMATYRHSMRVGGLCTFVIHLVHRYVQNPSSLFCSPH